MSYWLYAEWNQIKDVYENDYRRIEKSSLSASSRTSKPFQASYSDCFTYSRFIYFRCHTFVDYARWYNRLNDPEDPWISIEYIDSHIFYGPYLWRLLLHRDHPNLVLYGEFNDPANANLLSTRGGANVYIRSYNLCRMY